MLKNLTALRKEANLSFEDLAKITGHPKSVVFDWENGFCTIGVKDLIILSDYFKVSIDYLLDRDDKQYRIDELIRELNKIDRQELIKFIRDKISVNLND